MSYLIVEARDKQHEKQIQEVLKKMNTNVMTEEEEDAAFVLAMKEVDFSKTVSLSKLRKQLRTK